jgi:hypothetical protein
MYFEKLDCGCVASDLRLSGKGVLMETRLKDLARRGPRGHGNVLKVESVFELRGLDDIRPKR